MPYIQNSVVKERKNVWRLSLLPEMFLAFLNVMFLFFQTLFGGMEQKSKVTTLRGNTTNLYPTRPNSGVPGNSRVNGFGGAKDKFNPCSAPGGMTGG